MSAAVTTDYSSTDAPALHALWQSTVATTHPAYALPASTFASLLSAPLADVYVARSPSSPDPVGFALTYLIRAGGAHNPAAQHYKGSLAALIVHPSHRRQGVGEALHTAALTGLETAVLASLTSSVPVPKEGELQLGSTFPRIFPGLPKLDGVEDAKRWLAKRGWDFPGSEAIDLYGRVPTGVDQEQFKKLPASHGVTFRAAVPHDEMKVIEFEKEFDSYVGWPDMFPKFFNAGKAADIHLAIAADGSIIGATLAALAPSPLHEVVAWPGTLGSNCAAIACVGVTSKSRGQGAGTGLVAAALQDLDKRGADGCFIDWVGLKGFYERFGLAQWEVAYLDCGRKVKPPV